jgi:hypothetical protein
MNPQARSSDLIVEPIDEELLVFDTERQLAHSLNPTAARVWQACDGQRDLEALAAECEIDQQTLALALERLGDVRLLEPQTTAEPIRDAPAAGVSRRAMLRKSVLTGAGLGIAIPLIRSITAPNMAMAASTCGGLGQACCTGSTCTSGRRCNSAHICAATCGPGGRHPGTCATHPCCAGSSCSTIGGSHSCSNS